MYLKTNGDLRAWAAGLGFQRLLRTQFATQSVHKTRATAPLHVEFGPLTLDSSTSCGPSLGRRAPTNVSSLPGEYSTLRVDLGPPTLASVPFCGIILPEYYTLHVELGPPSLTSRPCPRNTSLCMSSLGHRPWLPGLDLQK